MLTFVIFFVGITIFYPSFIECVTKPNIVVILMDDWGWNNWGIHASSQPNHLEVQTPNLDALARQGIILDRHYTPRMCGPSRNSFFTGRNSIHNNAANGKMGQYNMRYAHSVLLNIMCLIWFIQSAFPQHSSFFFTLNDSSSSSYFFSSSPSPIV